MAALNLILITIDSLAADHLGCYGYSKNTSPNIDNLASKGVLFKEAISNGGGTPEAFPSIMASVPPHIHPNRHREIMKRSITFSEILRRNGYKTAGFHSNPFLSRFFHYDKGFDTFDDSMTDPELQKFVRDLSPQVGRFSKIKKLKYLMRLLQEKHSPIVTSEQLTLKALSWLKGCSNNFFLWVHYMDVHHPYMPPQKYVRDLAQFGISSRKMISLYLQMRESFKGIPIKLSTQDLKFLNTLYDACIRYVDDNIGVLLDGLGGTLANTVVVVTADHGDAFGEHGFFGHSVLYDEVIHIPLIISGAEVPEDIFRDQVSTMDIAPTIVKLLGLKEVEEFQGRALLPPTKGEDREVKGIISVLLNSPLKRRMISYRTPQWKYIRSDRLNALGKVEKQELYNLTNDPEEAENLLKKETHKALEFESKLESYVRTSLC